MFDKFKRYNKRFFSNILLQFCDAVFKENTAEKSAAVFILLGCKRTKFEPYKGKYRRQEIGSIHQVSKNVWEGRYSPIVNVKRITRNIYAGSIEECEEKLAQMIAQMKEEYGIT